MLHSLSLSPSPSVSYPLPGFFPLILPPAFSFHFSLCPSVFSYIPVGEKDSHLVFPVSWLVWSWQCTSFQPSPFFWTIHTTCAVLTNLLNMVHPACSATAGKSTYTSGISCYFPFCKRRERKEEKLQGSQLQDGISQEQQDFQGQGWGQERELFPWIESRIVIDPKTAPVLLTLAPHLFPAQLSKRNVRCWRRDVASRGLSRASLLTEGAQSLHESSANWGL